MACSIVRRICGKAVTRSCLSVGGGGWRMVGTKSHQSVHYCPSTLPSTISPWLMLPPSSSQHFTMDYKFYSLADDKIITLQVQEELELPDKKSELIGSSHGWLAWFCPNNFDIYLSNPLSHRQVKLPSLRTLSSGFPQGHLRGWYCVTNLILSRSPEEDNCRAMMIFGPENRLAFCCPGKSTEWTHIGDLYHVDESKSYVTKTARSYEGYVYSSYHKLFFCITQFGDFEAWDLHDPCSPNLTPIQDLSVDDDNYPLGPRAHDQLKKLCRRFKVLVVFDSQVYLVMRHVMEQMATDGSYVDDLSDGGWVKYPYKTIGFDVYKYDEENRALNYVEAGSLDGLTFFIGNNHSFAMRSSDFPELKPNSIYFSDITELVGYRVFDINSCCFGGHDIGIFNYEDCTFSPCYYPCDVESIQRIIPPPTWFIPSLV